MFIAFENKAINMFLQCSSVKVKDKGFFTKFSCKAGLAFVETITIGLKLLTNQ